MQLFYILFLPEVLALFYPSRSILTSSTLQSRTESNTKELIELQRRGDKVPPFNSRINGKSDLSSQTRETRRSASPSPSKGSRSPSPGPSRDRVVFLPKQGVLGIHSSPCGTSEHGCRLYNGDISTLPRTDVEKKAVRAAGIGLGGMAGVALLGGPVPALLGSAAIGAAYIETCAISREKHELEVIAKEDKVRASIGRGYQRKIASVRLDPGSESVASMEKNMLQLQDDDKRAASNSSPRCLHATRLPQHKRLN